MITYLRSVFSHDLYQIGHCKVHNFVPPRQFQNDVRMEQIVALEQTSGKAIECFLVQKVSKELFSYLGIFRFRCVLHGVFEKVVLFTKFHTLLPAVVALVEVGGDAPELDQFVSLQLLGQRNVIEIVECINGRLETVVVLLVDQEAVQSLVHCFVVQVLYGSQVGFHQLQMVHLKK